MAGDGIGSSTGGNVMQIFKTAIIGLILYPLLTILYNLTLHPLARYPGPLLWGSSRLRYMYSYWTGWLHRDVQQLHEKYGSVVRIAPNELSFSDPRAWEDIYSKRGSSHPFPKSAVWHAPQPGRGVALINTLDYTYHAKMRKKMDPGFTERAVASQEEIIQRYTDIFIQKLHEQAAKRRDQGSLVEMVDWFTYVTLDIIGDLAFGEPFGCLENAEMNEWMGTVFNTLRIATCICTLRHYTWLTWVLLKMVPKSAKKKEEEHWSRVEEKVDRRLAQETRRPDFLSLWQRQVKGTDGLTMGEVYANSFVMTIAGSETTATTLSGITNYLVKNPDKLDLLTKEIRSRFATEKEIRTGTLKDLPYLNAVIKEGLRMCSAVPSGTGIIRISPPTGGTVCGQYVPGNVFLTIPPNALFLDKNRFFASTSFYPERWLAETAKDPSSPFFNDDRNAVQPFNVGPNSCIGKPLAMAEIRLILARLVWAFDMEEAETKAGKLNWTDQRTFTVVEKKPFEVKLVSRTL